MQRDGQVRRLRRGNVAVVALSLGTVLGFGALAVDISIQRVADVQVQAAIEAAVLGGAASLDRTIPGMFAARQRAVEIANLNPVVGNWELTANDVEVGVYDPSTETFTPVDPSTLVTGDELVLQVNALRISTTHDGIAAVLARAAFGTDGLSTTNTAMAMRPNQGGTAKSVPCYLPLAIPDCDYLDWMSGSVTHVNPPPRKFNQTSAVIDNIGWSRPQPKDNPGANETPNTTYIKEAFSGGGCHDETIELGQVMQVANGQNTSVLKYVTDILEGDIASVPPSQWDYNIADRPQRNGIEANCPQGKRFDESTQTCVNGGPGSALSQAVWDAEPVIEGPIALMKVDDCSSNLNFVGAWEISGFAWAQVYDVIDTASDKNIWVQLDFVNPRDFGGAVDPNGMGPVTGLDKPVLVF